MKAMSQSMNSSQKKKKSKTFDDSNQWKKEVEIDSLLGSETSSRFEKLINDYSNIEDSGLKISSTDSQVSYDSEKRKGKFKRMMKKDNARWAHKIYLKAISRLQNNYVKNNYYGDKDTILNPSKEE